MKIRSSSFVSKRLQRYITIGAAKRGGKRHQMIGLTFLTTGCAIAADLEIAGGENPKSANSVAVAVARAPAQHLHEVGASIQPAHLGQFLVGEQKGSIFSLITGHLSLSLPLQ